MSNGSAEAGAVLTMSMCDAVNPKLPSVDAPRRSPVSPLVQPEVKDEWEIDLDKIVILEDSVGMGKTAVGQCSLRCSGRVVRERMWAHSSVMLHQFIMGFGSLQKWPSRDFGE